MLQDFIKRAVDIAGSAFGILVTLPVFLILTLAIKLESSGPVFADIPSRVGRDRKVFKMYKFRSMIANAHNVLRNDPKYKDLYEKYKKGSFKIKSDEDPRITKVGMFIRKTSLDEIPQFINIFKGDMSLVGPRAFHVDEIRQQQKNFPKTKRNVELLLTVKPGLTGPWQVSGRSALDFPERVRLDADYVKSKSLGTDFKIILKTLPAVFGGEGK